MAETADQAVLVHDVSDDLDAAVQGHGLVVLQELLFSARDLSGGRGKLVALERFLMRRNRVWR